MLFRAVSKPLLFRFQPSLRVLVLPVHLPDDQEQNEGDRQPRTERRP